MPTNPPLLERRKLLGALLETTSGTANAPSTALANTEVYDIEIAPDGFFDGSENRPHGGGGGSAKRLIGKQGGKLTFKTRLRHGDATFTLLEGCSCVISGGDNEIAKPVWVDMTGRKTLTFRVWHAGRYLQIYGANGTVKFAPEGSAEPVVASWEFMGVWTAPGAQAMPSEPTLTTVALRAAGMTLTVGGGSIPQVDGWELDLGAKVSPRQDATAASGLHRYQVEDGNPKLKLTPEARLVAHYDAYGKLLAGTVEAISMVLTDGTNTITIGMPAAQRIAVTPGKRDEKSLDEAEFELHKDSSGDDVIFTESVPA